MLLSEFRAARGEAPEVKDNPGVIPNALYKSKESFNCYLTPAQAIALAREQTAPMFRVPPRRARPRSRRQP